MDHSHDFREELRGPTLDLRELIPEVYRGYAQLSRAAMADGALSEATKELLALIVGVTRECDGCIVSHARAARRVGVTRQELAEAMGVAIMMNGGPGTVWGARALRAYDEAVAERAGAQTSGDTAN